MRVHFVALLELDIINWLNENFCSFLQKLVFQAGSLPSKVICLTQVVTEDELKDDEEYEDILEDMRGEGGKYGVKRGFNI